MTNPTNQPNLPIIGRAERIDLPDYSLRGLPAKIDTGADISSLWASDIKETDDGRLQFVLFGPKSEHYTGKMVTLPAEDFKLTRIANSFGQHQMRYKVTLRIRVRNRLIRATFTLSDRSRKTYPILLGRRLLQGKFLVDVRVGQPLADIERAKREKLQAMLENQDDTKEQS